MNAYQLAYQVKNLSTKFTNNLKLIRRHRVCKTIFRTKLQHTTNDHHFRLKVKCNTASTHACTLAIDILVYYYRKYGQINRVHKTESNTSYGKVMSGMKLFFFLGFLVDG